ncbi:hypothetical protein MOV65_30460, partial [Neorhizobium sp. SHOUNA12B]|nr:hypothetical protein [Neorhizobium sp. SHOUNA12B]
MVDKRHAFNTVVDDPTDSQEQQQQQQQQEQQQQQQSSDQSQTSESTNDNDNWNGNGNLNLNGNGNLNLNGNLNENVNETTVGVAVDVGVDLEGYTPTDDDFADVDMQHSSIDGMFNIRIDDVLNNALTGEGNDVGNVFSQVANIQDNDKLESATVSNDGSFELNGTAEGGIALASDGINAGGGGGNGGSHADADGGDGGNGGTALGGFAVGGDGLGGLAAS